MKPINSQENQKGRVSLDKRSNLFIHFIQSFISPLHTHQKKPIFAKALDCTSLPSNFSKGEKTGGILLPHFLPLFYIR